MSNLPKIRCIQRTEQVLWEAWASWGQDPEDDYQFFGFLTENGNVWNCRDGWLEGYYDCEFGELVERAPD